MKVLLVYANNYDLLAPPPVGLSLLTRPLDQAGHELRLLDFMKEPNPDGLLTRTLDEFRPDLVGFSLRNLDSMSRLKSRNFVPDYVRWVALANRVSRTIIGGSAVIAAPQQLFERTHATFAMAGQAARGLPTFLDELWAGRTPFQCPGLLWRESGVVKQNPPDFSGYSDDGSIDWSRIDHPRYRGKFNNCCVITKTGCPHHCVFCDARETFGERFVPRPPEAIVADLDRDAADYQFHKLDYFFVDAIFNQPLEWAKAVLEAIIRRPRKLAFSAVIEPTADFDSELASLLNRAGCLMVTFLAGSLDDKVLERSRRPFDVATVQRVVALLEKEKVGYLPQFMLGGPGETRATVLGNFDHVRRWRPMLVEASPDIRILPRSELCELATGEGLIGPRSDLLVPTFYLSPELTNDLPWLQQQAARLGRFRLNSIPSWLRMMSRTRTAARQR